MKVTFSVLVLATSMTIPAGCAKPLERHTFDRPIMGTQFTVTVYARDAAGAEAAAGAALDRVEQLNAVMSDYDRTSELSRLSATAGSGRAVKVSDDLWNVLSRAQQMSRRCDGAFDVTVGPIVQLWRRARRNVELPAQRRLDEAMKATGYQHVRLDPANRTVELLRPDMQLDLGGIAKGYAAQAALDVLKSHGLARALVDGGGDMVMGAAPPDADGWRIGIAPLGPDAGPSRYLLLTDVAVATSGDAWQYVEIDGVRYSHIVNPKTGLGLTDRSGVTVIVRLRDGGGAVADALASAVSVLGPKRGLELVESTPGAAALIVRKAGDSVETFESSRMRHYPLAPETADEPAPR